MIFVSSNCVKNKKIKNSVYELVSEGFHNIELSGGTDYYDGYVEDLLELQDKYSLNYLLHNYFPPPVEPFMINLASLNDDIYKQSIKHCQQAISLCKKLGSHKYAVHAGFLVDFSPDEAGKNISLKTLNNRESALGRFSDALLMLSEYAGDDVTLYVENNVFSKSNLRTYQANNPFFLTDYAGWLEFTEKSDCTLLLDIAHLKVSSSSLGLSFIEQFDLLYGVTDYYHISGNDGFHDQNHSVVTDYDVLSILTNYNWSSKTFTLEVYNGMNSLHESFYILDRKINKCDGI